MDSVGVATIFSVEVLKLLSEKDLVQLSRTCKKLHNFLAESNNSLWEQLCSFRNLKRPSKEVEELGCWKNVYFEKEISKAVWRKRESRFKVVVVGDGGVGKSSFIRQHREGIFNGQYVATLGAEIHPIQFQTNSRGKVIFDVWDTAGPEKFGALRDAYYLNSHGAIVLFDVTSRISYKNIPSYYKSVLRVCEDIPMVLVGNKIDLEDRKVKPKDINFHRKVKIPYVEMSVKAAYHLLDPFLHIARKLLQDDNLIFETVPKFAAEVQLNLLPRPVDMEFEPSAKPRPQLTPRLARAIEPVLEGRRSKPSSVAFQSPTWFTVEGLRATPFYDPNLLIDESKIQEICSTNISEKIVFNDLADWDTISSSNNGGWKAFYFMQQGVFHHQNCAQYPLTASVIKSLSKICSGSGIGYAYFSAMRSTCKVEAHAGPCNLKLRLLVPLILPWKCGLKVGSEVRSFETGKAFLFDDSFIHEPWSSREESDLDSWRIILIIDLWHPDLTEEEIEQIRKLPL